MPTALITGASSGIGAAFAQELASRQTDLVLVARSEDKLLQLAQQLHNQYQIQVEVLKQDLCLPAAANRVFEATAEKNITVDLLINNAGFGDYGAFHKSQLSKQLEMIQLNIIALVDLTYQFLPLMQQRGSGEIINVSSIAAFQGMPYMSVYAATKAFVLSFSEALWAENQGKGVKVLALCPGSTKTDFFNRAGFKKFSSGSTAFENSASTSEVVKEALKALDKGSSQVVTGGLPNQLVYNLSRFLPKGVWLKMIDQQFRPDKA